MLKKREKPRNDLKMLWAHPKVSAKGLRSARRQFVSQVEEKSLPEALKRNTAEFICICSDLEFLGGEISLPMHYQNNITASFMQVCRKDVSHFVYP